MERVAGRCARAEEVGEVQRVEGQVIHVAWPSDQPRRKKKQKKEPKRHKAQDAEEPKTREEQMSELAFASTNAHRMLGTPALHLASL